MTSCPAETDLIGLVDGDLAPARAEEVTGHLADCAECRVALGRTEAALRYALGGLVDLSSAPPRRRSVRRAAPAMALAAAVLVAFGWFAARTDRPASPGSHPTPAAPGTALAQTRIDDLERRLDRLLVPPTPVEYGALEALGAAEARAILRGPEAARGALLAVEEDFPGTAAARIARERLVAWTQER